MQTILWLILAAPLVAFLVIVFGTLYARNERVSGYVSIGAILGAAVLAFVALAGTTSATHFRSSFDWFLLGTTRFTLGVLLVVVGMQFVSLGLLSELITSQHEERAPDGSLVEPLVDEVLD